MRTLATLLLLAAALRAEPSEVVERLLERGIEPETDSISVFLRRYRADGTERDAIAAWVARLGARDPALRDEAGRRLAAMAPRTIDALAAATADPHPDVRRRARVLLARATEELRLDVVEDCLLVIRERNLPGLAEDLLATIDLWDAAYLRERARAALRATVRPADAPLLARARDSAVPEVRFAAILASAVLGDHATRRDLAALLHAPGERDRLAAAHALADLGDRRGLEPLGCLLDAEDPWVRAWAASTLRHVSGERFGLYARDPPEVREEALAAWRAWIASEGRIATWTAPVPEPRTNFGRILVAHLTEGLVVEFDADGREVWRHEGIARPWACTGLPNGHRLVGSGRDNSLTEFDRQGRIVWHRQDLPSSPSSVQRLDNGNTLVTCAFGEIVEIAPCGTQVDTLELAGGPTCARRLPNGRTLVALSEGGEVVEIDRDGVVVWRLPGLRHPYTVQPLGNGNILVAESLPPRVLEVTRAGKVVWTYEPDGWCYCAQRLPNGDTLVGDRSGVHVVARDGTVCWSVACSGYVCAERY